MSQAILKDAVIVRDPLLSLCAQIRNRADNEVFSKWMGLTGPDYLNDLIVTCRYLKAMTPFVVHGFLRFFPDVSGLDDSGIPIYYSPTAFAENFDRNVLQWLHERARVFPGRVSQEGIRIHRSDSLHPCRVIQVEFEGSGGECSSGFALHHINAVDVDSRTNVFKATLEFPDDPPDPEYFRHWVVQSINQAARGYLYTVQEDVFYANMFDAEYAPPNDFIRDLISATLSVEESGPVCGNLSAEVAFGLELPVSIDVDLFFRIRSDETSLLAFRSYLRDALQRMSGLARPDDLHAAANGVRTDLRHKHLPELKKALSSLYKDEALKWVEVAAGVGVGCVLYPSVAALIAIGLAAAGVRSTRKNIERIKKMPGYFWSRILKEER